MPPLNLSDALKAILEIPAIAQIYSESDQPYLERLILASERGLMTGGIGYRIYFAASLYLGSHPELRFVSLHDGTKVGDIDALLDQLAKLQQIEDDTWFGEAPSAKLPKRLAPIGTYSVRGYTEP
jgi:hypothetical protein